MLDLLTLNSKYFCALLILYLKNMCHIFFKESQEMKNI